MNSTDSVSKKRPVGRPRSDGKPHLTKEAVFWVSANLFAKHGFAGASIRMIADALDVASASLFNLFPNKEAILNELIEYASVPSLTFHAELRELSLSPPIALYKSLHEEVKVVASANRDFAAMFYLPEVRKKGFEPAQKARANMIRHYETLIEAGVTSGDFSCEHPPFVAEQFFQLTETSILLGRRAHRLSIEKQATLTARLCLRAALRKISLLDAIEREAGRVDLEIRISTKER